MVLQRINWSQIDTENVPTGSTTNLGSLNIPIDGIYTDELYISGSNFFSYLTGHTFSGSTAYATTGSNVFIGNQIISGSIDITGEYRINGELITGFTGSGIWKQTGSFYAANQNLQVTGVEGSLMNSPDGTVLNKYAFEVSQSIHSENINVGTPTSNDWGSNLDGSYFNNFNKNTDVSEILRFVAGILSSSTPNPNPNNRIYNGFTVAVNNNTIGSSILGYKPLDSTNSPVLYLASKGFANNGETLFNGISPIYNDGTLYRTFTSVASGTTVDQSSNDPQLFGLGSMNNGNPTSFYVSGSFTYKFKDNSDRNDTSVTTIQSLITQNGQGITSGVTLSKIDTTNPTVIPPVYQDGKYDTIYHCGLYDDGPFVSGINGTGYYHISSSLKIGTTLTGFTSPISYNQEYFYSPLTEISSNIGVNPIGSSNITITPLSPTLRSLSGAPYLRDSQYVYSGSLSSLFNPLYHSGNIASISVSGGSFSVISGNYTSLLTGGTVQTLNSVYDSTGVVVRNVGVIPYETDIVKVNGLVQFQPTDSNIIQIGVNPSTFPINLNGTNKNGVSSVINTQTPLFHDPGSFGITLASGSLAYYGRAQNYDSGSLSGASIVESLTGENYRIKLNNNILTFNGDPWDTTYSITGLTGNDLQVKPGYLVKPGGSYGYWSTDPDVLKTYKYYVRRFKTNGTTKSTMSVNMGKVLTNWGLTTNDAVSSIILFSSSKSGIYTPPRFYDPSNLLDNFTATKIGNTDGQNPFTSNFDLYGNIGGTLSTTTYTLPLRNGDGMILNSTYDEIYLIVRYNGNPSPITTITVTFS